MNRDQLMPTREQLERAEAVVNEYRAKLGNKIRLLFVVPDYFENKPKACMNGWGSVFLAVAADGSALPCHAAKTLPGLSFPNVTEQTLEDIWYKSDTFNAFRGFEWMKEPCRSCSEKEKDFGGCRCQAYALTGDAAAADPVCGKSEFHDDVKKIVLQARQRPAEDKPLVYRNDANSMKFAGIPIREAREEV